MKNLLQSSHEKSANLQLITENVTRLSTLKILAPKQFKLWSSFENKLNDSRTWSELEHSCKVPGWPLAMKETLSNFFEAVVCSINWNSDSREEVLSWIYGTICTPDLRDEFRRADWRVFDDNTTIRALEAPELEELFVRTRFRTAVPSRAEGGLSNSLCSKPFWWSSVPALAAIEWKSQPLLYFTTWQR